VRQYYVYILASHSRAIYIGVTNDLVRRILQHRAGDGQPFTHEYRVQTLVYFETTANIHAAIAREKQLKRWPRWRKDRLIESHTPDWRDLSIDIAGSAINTVQ
jgi:putative endonuclease